MQSNKPKQTINNLTGHASLLLPATKSTNADSPMQKTTNRTTSHPEEELSEDNAINFIKPQNEIFKKLDGKIQQIVAAHSTMNKMYSLNDFSGVGPKKPIELPPQLPRPPPWVPKVSSDYSCSQWAEESLNSLNRSSPSIDYNESSTSRQSSSFATLNRVTKVIPAHGGDIKPNQSQVLKMTPPVLTIDSAISKLHQRREQQNLQHRPQQMLPHQARHSTPISQQPRMSTQARLLQQAHELQQQLRAAAAANQKQNQQLVNKLTTSTASDSSHITLPSTSALNETNIHINSPTARKSIPLSALLQMQKRPTDQTRNQQSSVTICPPLTPEEKRRFQNELINIFRQEIAAVTKLAKIKFSPQVTERPRTSDPRSLLIKKSPQSLFNTIRRETSLLLKRGDAQQCKPSVSGLSLLNNRRPQARLQPLLNNRQATNLIEPLQTISRPQVNRYNTIKIVVPPSEFYKHTCSKHSSGRDNNPLCNCYESKADLLDIDQWLPYRKFSLKYQTLQMKFNRLKFFPRKDEFNRKRGVCISMTPADARRKKSPQKSLDRIVDRLQARCLSSTSSSPVNPSPKNLPSSVSSPPNPNQTSRETTPSPPSSPKPIPIFRAVSNPPKGYLGSNNTLSSQKLKKAKRLHHLGLKLGNYMERENPTPITEKLTIEQFAKCLNLVRKNDASLQRHQEKLMQSDLKWRIPVGDRPLRLRRIRGERVHMPASASYRATRKVGLQ